MLHEKVQRWVWRQGWEELRDIQERSIPILIDGRQDLIVAAGTASGKTEAAFLPIVSRLATDARPPGAGFEAIYISPLRALINDQFGRIETLCDELELPVVKWHGDVSASVKARARKKPHGILLTTPESLEAILVRGGAQARRLFAALSYVVIDEMHAFMDAPRGRQLQSLLNRVELAAGHRVVRVGLSATLADMQVSAAFLRPLDPGNVAILESGASSQELRLQVRGYIEPPMTKAPKPDADGTVPDKTAIRAITAHMFQTLRGHRSLIFAGSRQRVELFTAGLSEMSEEAGVPDEFFAHHGSLSREHREEAERRLKDETRPGSLVATTTMELGLDVGHIEAVAQFGPGMTVSGMRQRLGRSGRRAGQPSVMRVYVAEAALVQGVHPLDAMRPTTVQTVAMLNLMLRRWNEPSPAGRLHLSTLVHQILALIAQHGGLTAQQGWERLVTSGVFPNIDRSLYAAVLRRMGHADVQLIDQAPDGTLLPGAIGEKVIGDRGFYAVFMTPEEFKIVTDRGKSLGTIPVDNPVMPEQLLIFAGRRWKVTEVNLARREILVTPARGGTPPVFGGDLLPPSDEVVAEMRRVYNDATLPRFVDETAAALLDEARDAFTRAHLKDFSLARHEDQLLLLPWVGGRAQVAFVLALNQHGVSAVSNGLAVVVPTEQAGAMAGVLAVLARSQPPSGVELALLVPDMVRAKYDSYLGTELLAQCYASEHIDAARVPAIAADLLSRMPPGWQVF